MPTLKKAQNASFNRHRDARGRFCKAPANLAQAVEATPKVPSAAPAAEAPAPKAFVVPDLRIEDLLVREGYHQIPHKEYKKLLKEGYEVQTLRNAVAAMVALGVRLPEALALVKAVIYRPWMIDQLKVILDHPQFVEVLEWVSSNPKKGVYYEYRKADALLVALTKVRTDGQAASVGSLPYLARAAKLLGWINQ